MNMMKRFQIWWIVVGFVLLSWKGNDQVVNNTFTKGEFMKFRIHYGPITAGFATLEVMPDMATINGKPCIHIVGKGFTNSTFDVFYKVRDQYETFMDRETLLSRRFYRHIREGKFESYTETHFDQENQKARYINPKKVEIFYDVPEGIQDVISAFYFARAYYDHEKLEVGDKISLRNFLDRKTFALEAQLLERETIKVDGKTYKALRMGLLIEEAGLITDGSKIEFWISDDANKLPLRIKSDLVIGSLKADLVETQNLLNPFDALVE